MFSHVKRIYALAYHEYFKYSFLFFLVNHKRNEMVKAAWLYDIKIVIMKSKNILHWSKVLFLTSNVKHKTFEYNNFINFMQKHVIGTSMLFFKHLYYKNVAISVKQAFTSWYAFLNASNVLLYRNLFSLINGKKLKIYIVYAVLMHLRLSLGAYLHLAHNNIDIIY